MRERIGSYRIEKVLAEGGMGLVYKGRHDGLGRDAAIKALLPNDAGDAALRQRLLREAQAQARLQHPNIVTVYDLIDENQELFIAMELVEGGTLEAHLVACPRGRMPFNEVLPLFEQILDALEYVHGEKIIHRDVKPSNVMICGSRVKLADFGIALLTETPRITTSLRVIGSPPYMSPEQLEAKSIDHRSDIYSAALVLYRMLAGRLPFEAKEYLARIHERMVGPPDLRTVVPELPGGFCEAVAIALRHHREHRFPSVAAFRGALREGAAGFFVSEPQPLDEIVVASDAPTEPLGNAIEPASESEPRRATAIVSIVIAGAFVAAISVVVAQRNRQPFPVEVPAQKLAAVIPAPLPIILEASAPSVPVVAQPKQEEPRDTEPRMAKREPFATPKSESTEDEATKRRRELDALREAIHRGLARAEQELGVENFGAAIDEIDRIAEMAQRRPEDLREEREQIAQLRGRVINVQVAGQTRKAQDALWASRIAEIEEDLRAERWPEAERFAKNIADDPRAPESIAARAQALLLQAKEGLRSAFSDTKLGPNSNTIRKPSSPPRKEH